ncbi:alternative ribosome rescue aminoacyl-tRNA hydrolase ArfB [Celerinatantimonas sp. YJH-8]|uniref:alternative ribosome rescue aminoacyl-tRNA hydrolase ArfB n=1 Tax=Celerinatantimonas sp. YJH-8 TaxID=3228714 RepID=UPI0038C08F0E
MLEVQSDIHIPESALLVQQIRASGPGGQNVNKVASAVELRCYIAATGLSWPQQQRIRQFADQRITRQGEIVIKAQQYRTYQQNLEDARLRLVELLQKALYVAPKRRPTRPTRASVSRRLESKKKRSETKSLRSKPY